MLKTVFVESLYEMFMYIFIEYGQDKILQPHQVRNPEVPARIVLRFCTTAGTE